MTMTRGNTRRRLDQRLEPLHDIDFSRPHAGWIRAIREALRMSTTELAARMGVSQQRITVLEQAEVNERIGMATLRTAADALDCDLVYALVPRTSLDDAVHRQARRLAQTHLAPLRHHSRLEDQSIDAASTEALVEDLAESLIDRRGLWRSPASSR